MFMQYLYLSCIIIYRISMKGVPAMAKQNLTKAKEAELYDKDGNLIAHGSITLNTGKKPNIYFKKGDFFTMSRLFAKMMMDKTEYNNLTFRLLFLLMNRIDFNNRIQSFSQAELAEELKARQPHVSTSLRVLIADNIVEKRGRDYYFTENFIRYASDGKFPKFPTDSDGHEYPAVL